MAKSPGTLNVRAKVRWHGRVYIFVLVIAGMLVARQPDPEKLFEMLKLMRAFKVEIVGDSDAE